jgi:hypothetical protein
LATLAESYADPGAAAALAMVLPLGNPAIEVAFVNGFSTPVVYQKLRVRRSMPAPQQDDLVTWEIWNDSLHSRFSQRVEHGDERQLVDSNLQSYRESKFSFRNRPGVSVLAELEEIYTLNRMDFRRPLSLNAHPSWRESIEHDLVEVKETQLSDATKGVWLSKSTIKPASQNQVVRAEMLVRATDWHPIEQRLSVRKKDNIQYYALSELSFNLLASNWMPLWSSSNFSVPFQTSPLPAFPPSRAYLTPQLLEDEIFVRLPASPRIRALRLRELLTRSLPLNRSLNAISVSAGSFVATIAAMPSF